MNETSTIIPCPNCGAQLNDAGYCAHCGGQARGFWRDLDLGTPELAMVVMEGLDYYLVLNVAEDVAQQAIEDAYRHRRLLYPHDARYLHPQVARQLGLLEEAWRILGVPQRRALYDQLRQSQHDQTGERAAVRGINCVSCGAAVSSSATFCPACGSQRDVAVGAELGDAPVEYLPNYYETLGLSPLMSIPPAANYDVHGLMRRRRNLLDLMFDDDADVNEQLKPVLVPPSDDQIRLAYLARQRELAFRNDPQAETEVEVAFRVLSHPHRRATYDHLLQAQREQGWTKTRMRALSGLDREARAEIKGVVAVDGEALLQQGKGYLKLNLAGQAVPVLKQACQALPDSAEAHYNYGLALWRSADLISLTAHQLRECVRALERAAELDSRITTTIAPILTMCRGLQSYNDGNTAQAEHLFSELAQCTPSFVPAWRMLAAIALRNGQYETALGYAHQALNIEPSSEPVLLLAMAACWRQAEHQSAYELAARIGALRGNVPAETVLREFGLI
jgi:curved DNA-binding protein CbpA